MCIQYAPGLPNQLLAVAWAARVTTRVDASVNLIMQSLGVEQVGGANQYRLSEAGAVIKGSEGEKGVESRQLMRGADKDLRRKYQ